MRASLLARSRPTRREYEVGEWVYYWKEAKGPYLEKVHWHGPAMVCMKQPKLSDNDVVVDFVYWLVHGTSIFRAIPELVRPEYPDERATRETKTGGVLQSVEEVLAKTRGVVNFYDLSKDEKCQSSLRKMC